jgi:hypothetical protein
VIYLSSKNLFRDAILEKKDDKPHFIIQILLEISR